MTDLTMMPLKWRYKNMIILLSSYTNLLESSLRKQVSLDSGQSLMGIVISLLNQTKLLSL